VCCGDDAGRVVSLVGADGRRLILSDADADYWSFAVDGHRAPVMEDRFRYFI